MEARGFNPARNDAATTGPQPRDRTPVSVGGSQRLKYDGSARSSRRTLGTAVLWDPGCGNAACGFRTCALYFRKPAGPSGPSALGSVLAFDRAVARASLTARAPETHHHLALQLRFRPHSSVFHHAQDALRRTLRRVRHLRRPEAVAARATIHHSGSAKCERGHAGNHRHQPASPFRTRQALDRHQRANGGQQNRIVSQQMSGLGHHPVILAFAN